jgi:hypothetical protein
MRVSGLRDMAIVLLLGVGKKKKTLAMAIPGRECVINNRMEIPQPTRVRSGGIPAFETLCYPRFRDFVYAGEVDEDAHASLLSLPVHQHTYIGGFPNPWPAPRECPGCQSSSLQKLAGIELPGCRLTRGNGRFETPCELGPPKFWVFGPRSWPARILGVCGGFGCVLVCGYMLCLRKRHDKAATMVSPGRSVAIILEIVQSAQVPGERRVRLPMRGASTDPGRGGYLGSRLLS